MPVSRVVEIVYYSHDKGKTAWRNLDVAAALLSEAGQLGAFPLQNSRRAGESHPAGRWRKVVSTDDKCHSLRSRAEAIAHETGFAGPPESMSPEALRRALHELQVHQIELEIQNEELLRVQIELEAARARYFDLYHLAPVSYCTLSEEGLILEANLTFASLFGISRGLLLMRPIVRLIADEDQDIYFLYRRQLIATSKPQACELRMVKADGATFWARLEATTMQDKSGTLLCFLAISDISERRQAEDALRESQDRFSLFMDALPAAAFIKDAQGTILFVNRYLADLVGGQAWLGKSTRDLFPPVLAEKMVADDQRAMAERFSGHRRA
jgi:PAS domain S-box-containing protein